MAHLLPPLCTGLDVALLCETRSQTMSMFKHDRQARPSTCESGLLQAYYAPCSSCQTGLLYVHPVPAAIQSPPSACPTHALSPAD
jgi:hypothetical protein